MHVCTKCQKEANPTHYVSGRALCHSCYCQEDRQDVFQCPECGLYDAPSCWLGGLPRGLCSTCNYWQDKVEAMSDPAWAIRIAIIDGRFYGIDLPDKFNSKRGTIRFQNGRIQDYGFLGNGSRIPEHFRARLPDNATWEVVKDINMSYTPEDQKLEKPIANLKKAVLEVQEVLRNRINDQASDWSQKHLEECREWIYQLTDWEMQLNRHWPK